MLPAPSRPKTREHRALLKARLMPGGYRQRKSALIIALASTVWIGCLLASGQALPWCIALGAIASGAALPRRGGRVRYAPLPVLHAERQPVTFWEAYALAYTAASLAMAALIVCHIMHPEKTPAIKRQIVDIELTGLNDFQNNHDPLPGSQEKASLRKRQASTITQHGETYTHPAPPRKLNARLDADRLENGAVQSRPRLNKPDARLGADRLKNGEVQSQPRLNNNRSQTISPFWEEVKAPEMVEVVDNEGDNSFNIWQAGGHSSGGTGSKSQLLDYLKELNKRIKRAWSPPRGETRKTEILFRIKKSGQLSSVRLLKSSGNPDLDRSAIEALVSCAPFPALPADYPHPYLDLNYSFNYNVDEITETTSESR